MYIWRISIAILHWNWTLWSKALYQGPFFFGVFRNYLSYKTSLSFYKCVSLKRLVTDNDLLWTHFLSYVRKDSDSISCPFVWDIFLNTGKIKSPLCSSSSFKYHFVVQSFLVSFHCAVFAKSFDSIMIIGVENGSEKYQTKRVNAIQFESKLSGNISKMWLTYFYDVSVFFFTVSKMH